ncbi:Uncharacterised protein [Salmonella enterica subsp. enterica]|uniref:Uncharacterized protein n=1 Tax=Salmonella enterica I TaxID=59201 RepID=A0A379WJE8_SALET|nr:Uncharacterised protein [Salmonella enterica subsp. enterica]
MFGMSKTSIWNNLLIVLPKWINEPMSTKQDKPPILAGLNHLGQRSSVSCTDCSNGMSMALNSSRSSTRLTYLRLAGGGGRAVGDQNDPAVGAGIDALTIMAALFQEQA